MRAALVVGHPGHELRVHHWLEIAAPVAFVLTDGSGRAGRSRLDSTTRVLAVAGARPGDVYGRFTDGAVYDIIRSGDVAPLVEVMQTLATAFETQGVDYVVGDALEGFNPSHDLCRHIVNGAVLLVAQRTGRLIRNLDFLLDGRPDDCPAGLRAQSIEIHLDDEALGRKLAAASAYPELKAETESALARFGPGAFSTELLRPVVDARQGLDGIDPDPPFYERFGEQQVRAGFYDSVIRYRTAVQPLVQALWRQAGLNEVSAGMTDTIASAAIG